MSNPRHILYFILLTLFWGGSFLAIGISVKHLPPFFSAFLRTFIAFICITFYLVIKRRSLKPPKVWLQSMGSGIFMMGIAWVFLFWGEKYVSPALAAILNGTVPIFTTILTPLLTPQDKLSWNKWMGILLGFLGVLLIFVPELSLEVTFFLKGLIAILLMAICYAIAVLWTRRLTTKVGNAINLFYQTLSSACFLLLVSAIFEGPRQTINISWEPLAALLYLGTFSTAIAWLMLFVLIKEVGSIQAAAITYCVPLIAISLDFFFWDRWLTWNQILGAIVILGAVFLINQRPRPTTPMI